MIKASLIVLCILVLFPAIAQQDTFLRYKVNVPYNYDAGIKFNYKLGDKKNFLVSCVFSDGVNNQNESIIFTDEFGNIVWHKQFNFLNYKYDISSSILLSDENLLLIGTLSSKTDLFNFSNFLFVCKVSKGGSIIWANTLQLNRFVNNTEFIYSPIVTEASDGGLYASFGVHKTNHPMGLSGYEEDFPAIIKLSNSGGLLWSRYFFNSREPGTIIFPQAICEINNKVFANFGFKRCEGSFSCNN